MLQNVITELVCINCEANLMADLAEDGALFDTARGNGGTTGNLPTGFDCPGVSLDGWLWLANAPHIAKAIVAAPTQQLATYCATICKECDLRITWDVDLSEWLSNDGRSCQQIGATSTSFYQQHEPA